MRLVFDDGERCWPVATLAAGDRTRVDVTATPTLVLIEVGEEMFAFPPRCSSETRLPHVGYGTHAGTGCVATQRAQRTPRNAGPGGYRVF
jgi:hypothetical protein